MNFAKLFIPNLTSYKLLCRDDVIETEAALNELFDRADKSTPVAPPNPALLTDTTTVERSLAHAPLAVVSSVEANGALKSDAFPVRGYVLEATAKDKEKEPRILYKFEVKPKLNLFQKIIQPNFVGMALAGSGSDVGTTTLQVQTKPPFWPVQLINWSANFALFAVFGVAGSYLLLPDPTPMGVVFAKIAVVPLLFSIVLSGLVNLSIQQSREQIMKLLATVSRARETQRVELDQSVENRKVIFSARTLATFIFLFGMLVAAVHMHEDAWQLWVSGQYQKSEDLCAPVLKLADLALGKETSGAAGCNYYLAECSRCEGKLPQARALYKHALALFQQNLDPGNTIIADCTANLGRTEELSNNYSLALDHYIEAKKIYSQSPNFGPKCIWVGRLHDRIAAIQMKMKKFDDAEASERQALKIDTTYRDAGGRSVAEDLNDLGVILFNEGRVDEAKKALAESLAKKKNNSVNDPFSVAVTAENLAIATEKLGDKSESAKLHEQSLQKFREFLKTKKVKVDGKSNATNLYSRVLSCTKEMYEVPVYDTRTDSLIGGPGRI